MMVRTEVYGHSQILISNSIVDVLTKFRRLETPSIAANQGVWTSYGSAIIKAPASKVWQAICDFPSYEKWNDYTPKIETPKDPITVGDIATIHYRPEPEGKLMTVPCRVMELSDERRSLCWRGLPLGCPAWLLLPEKVQRVTEKGDNECLFEVFETQSGPLAYLVKYGMGAKQSAMNHGIAAALKEYVEGQS